MTNWELLYEEMKRKDVSERALCLGIGRSHGWLHNARKRNSDLKMSDVEKICAYMEFSVKQRYDIFLAAM